MYLSPDARAYKDAAADILATQGWTPDTCVPRHCEVVVTMHWLRESRRGDIDKRQGVLLDALQGLLYENDDQLAGLSIRRVAVPKGFGGMLVACERAG